MKTTAKIRNIFLVATIIGLAAAPAISTPAIPDEALSPGFLCEVGRHLYRWYLDEHDVEKIEPDSEIKFWLYDVTPTNLDSGDRSRIIEITLPVFDVRVIMKKTDYRIPELDMEVKSKTFKITDVTRDPHGTPVPEGAVEKILSVAQIKDYLFRTRAQRDPLTPELGRHVREAIRRKISDEDGSLAHDIHEVHIAPLSPIANELWIFWETDRRLIRVTSDLEITNPAMWQHERLTVRVYDIDHQTVVSLVETPGSNAYLTRDQVGRALFNCMVLGHDYDISREQNNKPIPSTERMHPEKRFLDFARNDTFD